MMAAALPAGVEAKFLSVSGLSFFVLKFRALRNGGGGRNP